MARQNGFIRISGLAKDFASKLQHRITAQHAPSRLLISSQPLSHSSGFGLRQLLHQPSGAGIGDGLFIHTAHLHAVGNGR